ncbi:MAG: glycosyltransferase [Gemmatimonas sp.]
MTVDVQQIDLATLGRSGPELPRKAARVLLRLGGIPIGQVHLPPSAREPHRGILAGTITSAHAERALRMAMARWITRAPDLDGFQLDDALDGVCEDAISQTRPPFNATDPTITVAICSRDRPVPLTRAIEALLPHLGIRDELLVVLNAPSDSAWAIDARRFPSVRVVHELRPGLGWARNRALHEFRSEILLFTDDDCVPDARWVDAHRALFARNPDVDVATGLVEPLSLSTPAQQLFEDYGGFPRNYDRRWISAPRRPAVADIIGNVGEFGAGANLAIRRQLIERIGPFDAALGPGTESGAGDDVEFLFRALKLGSLLAIEPRAAVQHEHRRDIAELEAQIEGWSRGFSCASARSGLAFPEERTALTVLRARIAFLHHARRAVLHPRFRRLALAELRGMRAAAKHYARARETARDLAGRESSPASDAPPVRSHAPSRNDATARAVVAIDDLRGPLRLGRDTAFAACDIRIRGQSHVLTVPVVNGTVGADRLQDAVIPALGHAIIGREWREAIQHTHDYLRRLAARRNS